MGTVSTQAAVQEIVGKLALPAATASKLAAAGGCPDPASTPPETNESRNTRTPAPVPVFSSLRRNERFPSSYASLEEEQKRLFELYARQRSPQSLRDGLAGAAWEELSESERSTFAGISHALVHTHLQDAEGNDLGPAAKLVTGIRGIHGEDHLVPSDHQFLMHVELDCTAVEKLSRAADTERGINHLYHKEFPLSFRQIRHRAVRFLRAGLHWCVSPNGRFASVHVDYRFGLKHLGPGNADVRAADNFERHKARWPGLKTPWREDFSAGLPPAALRAKTR